MSQLTGIKLSICIGTYNRAHLIGATLESMIEQLTDECEIVVSDNASTDDTASVVAEYTRRCDRVRYVRQDSNQGLDRNFDRAVELADGEYCWLMADDDLLRPGAIARVLNELLRRDLSLMIVNIEFWDFALSRILQRSAVNFTADRLYGPTEMDRLFTDLDQDLVMYIGGLVIKREIWLTRERERYYDSLFIHVAIVYQKHWPGEALVIAEPLVRYRLGNTHAYSSRMIEIIYEKWPSLIKSLAISETARRKVDRAEPWRHASWLLLLRGWGYYSPEEYARWIRPQLRSFAEKVIPMLVAFVPGVVANTLLVTYFFARRDRGRWLLAVSQSRLNIRKLRFMRRAS